MVANSCRRRYRLTRSMKKASSPPKKSGATIAKRPSSSAAGDCVIVGVGASAGGLAAFERFFGGAPRGVADPGLAIVLLQHLSPDHRSALAECVQRYTRMRVAEIVDGTPVRSNHVYVLPPNHDVTVRGGVLRLDVQAGQRGQQLPIDHFFHSLARDQRTRAVGVVLSGNGRDGTEGLRAIRAAGGLTLVQEPTSAECDGMPRSAIEAGVAERVVPPAEMFACLLGPRRAVPPPPLDPAEEPARAGELGKIFLLLRSHTGHDFSLYKPSTVHRRVERRMAAHQIATLSHYVRLLQSNPEEVEALFRDLLIGVTNFFRDPEAFAVLEKSVLPTILGGKPPGGLVRVWVPGCSTGEEAYSLAILIAEHLAAAKLRLNVQVFATDLDSAAIITARAGVYPAAIASHVSPERLSRFFTAQPESGSWKINRSIRDMLVFSEQDVTKDPPFSKLDLISCRNLLIYMGGELQRRLIPLFHYALHPGGFLFLGTSESIGEHDELFTVVDRKAKVYQRKPASVPRRLSLLPPLLQAGATLPLESVKKNDPTKKSLRELAEQALLQRASPAGALVTSKGDILYLHGRTGQFLEPAAGEVGTANLLKMAQEGLRHDLTLKFREAVRTGKITRCPAVHINPHGRSLTARVSIHPLGAEQAAGADSRLFLVVLEEVSAEAAPTAVRATPAAKTRSGGRVSEKDRRIAALESELKAKEESLQGALEELQSSTEELKSYNEEMQSVNEELQSTNEELETSKEELQSVNEELTTVNTELQSKVADLTRANNDMSNLMAGTGIATIFVDHQLRIMRFTPPASLIINLIPGDVGRPLAHIVSNLVGYSSLIGDVQAVLKTLAPKTVEVQTRTGEWYSARIQPYRTVDNMIEGAVITFADISDIVRTNNALARANQIGRLSIVVRDSSDAITMQDLEGRILAWNPAAVQLYGWTESEALRLNAVDRIPAGIRSEELANQEQLLKADRLLPVDTERLGKDGRVRRVSVLYSVLRNEEGKVYALATTERALTH